MAPRLGTYAAEVMTPRASLWVQSFEGLILVANLPSLTRQEDVTLSISGG